MTRSIIPIKVALKTLGEKKLRKKKQSKPAIRMSLIVTLDNLKHLKIKITTPDKKATCVPEMTYK